MKGSIKKGLITTALIGILPFAAAAETADTQESEVDLMHPTLSASVAVTSNYVWRGVSQTSNEMAYQGDISASWNGLYIGAWGSTVKFWYPVFDRTVARPATGVASSSWTDAYLEVDTYLGYKHEFSNGFGVDVGFLRYWYPDASYFDFNEGYFNVSYKIFNAGVAYSDDALATGGSGTYWHAGVESEIFSEHVDSLSVSANVGTYQFASKTGLSDYVDYNVGIAKGFAKHFTIGAQISSTNRNFTNNKLDKTLGIVTLSADLA